MTTDAEEWAYGHDCEPVSECRCAECATIHSEFIGQFGRWPSMSHAEGQQVRDNRADNLASWERVRR